jgi:ferredoxin
LAYSSASLHVTSGTGNTLRVARWMAETIEAQGTPVEIRRIEEGTANDPPDRGEDHLLGLLSPTHAFTAAWRMIWLACRLPRGAGTHAFVTLTRAGTKFGPFRFPGLEGTGGYLLWLILVLKGYRVRGVLAIDMPSNWIAFHPGFAPAAVSDIIAHARPKSERYVQRLLAGKRWFGGWIPLLLGFLLLPVSLAYLAAGRFFLAKTFFASNRCTACGRCAEKCPFGAIRMWGRTRRRPYWTMYCESCMRCMAYCPERAIEAGHSWAVLLYFAVTVPVAVWLFNSLEPLIPWIASLDHPAVLAVVQYVYFLVALVVAYFLFWVLIHIPPINTLFTYTTLTRIYRRYHEPDTEAEELRGKKKR